MAHARRLLLSGTAPSGPREDARKRVIFAGSISRKNAFSFSPITARISSLDSPSSMSAAVSVEMCAASNGIATPPSKSDPQRNMSIPATLMA
jgi:hypothetical protein